MQKQEIIRLMALVKKQLNNAENVNDKEELQTLLEKLEKARLDADSDRMDDILKSIFKNIATQSVIEIFKNIF